MADQTAFTTLLEGEQPFHLRRAVERLREGLFDPLAVRLLTADEARLTKLVEAGFRCIEGGGAPHLCVVGAYGQGKSHSLTYIREKALREGFVASMINLDPREVPFYNVAAVYRALMASLSFPDEGHSLSERWRRWARARLSGPELTKELFERIPASMPHLFRCVLAASAMERTPRSLAQKRMSERYRSCHPRAFPRLLASRLAGDEVPTAQLRRIFKYLDVPGYREKSLSCRGPEVYLDLIRGMAALFRAMGYPGWVLCFDEGESIAQLRVSARSNAYRVLDLLLAPDEGAQGLYPVFAFTDDFFQQVREEDYTKVVFRRGVDTPYFGRNYAMAWKNLTVHRLQDLSSREWRELIQRLMLLHACTYQWKPPTPEVPEALAGRLERLNGAETRVRLKALVDELDLSHQQQLEASW